MATTSTPKDPTGAAKDPDTPTSAPPRTDTTTGRGDDVEVVVADAPRAQFTTKTSDVPVDPRTGQEFAPRAGLMGPHGFDLLDAAAGGGSVVQGVNPDAIPAEVTPGVSPDAGGDTLLAAAQAKCPGLTAEFVSAMGFSREYLAQVARGEVPGPPIPGPIHTSDFYVTPGGFQQTPPGVKPADVGGNAISR